ncbi:MAG: hypothetical protein H6679_05550 [Epsilonproteobacteria bacterium]|nr:hypothetical protein [Campylobacterota bacterium]
MMSFVDAKAPHTSPKSTAGGTFADAIKKGHKGLKKTAAIDELQELRDSLKEQQQEEKTLSADLKKAEKEKSSNEKIFYNKKSEHDSLSKELQKLEGQLKGAAITGTKESKQKDINAKSSEVEGAKVQLDKAKDEFDKIKKDVEKLDLQLKNNIVLQAETEVKIADLELKNASSTDKKKQQEKLDKANEQLEAAKRQRGDYGVLGGVFDLFKKKHSTSPSSTAGPSSTGSSSSDDDDWETEP